MLGALLVRTELRNRLPKVFGEIEEPVNSDSVPDRDALLTGLIAAEDTTQYPKSSRKTRR